MLDIDLKFLKELQAARTLANAEGRSADAKLLTQQIAAWCEEWHVMYEPSRAYLGMLPQQQQIAVQSKRLAEIRQLPVEHVGAEQ